jgi:hypothetical protein
MRKYKIILCRRVHIPRTHRRKCALMQNLRNYVNFSYRFALYCKYFFFIRYTQGDISHILSVSNHQSGNCLDPRHFHPYSGVKNEWFWLAGDCNAHPEMRATATPPKDLATGSAYQEGVGWTRKCTKSRPARRLFGRNPLKR